jgi:hypothetical protein
MELALRPASARGGNAESDIPIHPAHATRNSNNNTPTRSRDQSRSPSGGQIFAGGRYAQAPMDLRVGERRRFRKVAGPGVCRSAYRAISTFRGVLRTAPSCPRQSQRCPKTQCIGKAQRASSARNSLCVRMRANIGRFFSKVKRCSSSERVAAQSERATTLKPFS